MAPNLADLTIEQVFERLKDGLARVSGISPKDIYKDSRLQRDLGMDSMDFLDFTEYVSERFGKQVSDRLNELYKMPSVNPDEKFVERGYITEEGMEKIKETFPFGDFTILSTTCDYDDMDTILTAFSIAAFIHDSLQNSSQHSYNISVQ